MTALHTIHHKLKTTEVLILRGKKLPMSKFFVVNFRIPQYCLILKPKSPTT